MSEPQHSTDPFSRSPAEAATLNDGALAELALRHGVLFPRSAFPWRATRRVRGTHNVFTHATLTCVATDGMLAVFLDDSGGISLGHVAPFQWTEEITLKVPRIDPETGEETTVSIRQSAGAPPPLFPALRARSSVQGNGPKKPQIAKPKTASKSDTAVATALRMLGL